MEEFTDYYVAPDEMERHIKEMRKVATELNTIVAPVPGLCPPGVPSWTGAEGGHEALRKCLADLAKLVRKTNQAVIVYGHWATGCVDSYVNMDQLNADEIRKCLMNGPRP